MFLNVVAAAAAAMLLLLPLLHLAHTVCEGGLRELVMRGLERMDAIALPTNAFADSAQTKGRIDEPLQFSKLIMDVEDGPCLTSLVNSVTVAVNELKKFNAAAFPNIFSKDEVATYTASRTDLKPRSSSGVALAQKQWCVCRSGSN